MIKRWVHASIALDEHNEVVGVIYDRKGIKPFPAKKTPLQDFQSAERMTPVRHPPTTEQVRKAYGI